MVKAGDVPQHRKICHFSLKVNPRGRGNASRLFNVPARYFFRPEVQRNDNEPRTSDDYRLLFQTSAIGVHPKTLRILGHGDTG